jgi:hypothetical protein
MQRPGKRKNHGQRIKAPLRPERALPGAQMENCPGRKPELTQKRKTIH